MKKIIFPLILLTAGIQANNNVNSISSAINLLEEALDKLNDLEATIHNLATMAKTVKEFSDSFGSTIDSVLEDLNKLVAQKQRLYEEITINRSKKDFNKITQMLKKTSEDIEKIEEAIAIIAGKVDEDDALLKEMTKIYNQLKREVSKFEAKEEKDNQKENEVEENNQPELPINPA